MTETETKKDSPELRHGSSFFNLSSLPSLNAHLLFWFVVLAGVTADLMSKYAVFKWLQQFPNKDYCIIENLFYLVTRLNDGAAFSIAGGQRFLLVSVSSIAMIMVIVIFLFGRIQHKLMQVSLALFTAGIIGNLYDRLFNDGYVRDFLDFYFVDAKGVEHHWPAFNVADSMLCIAVGLMVIINFTTASSQKPAHQQK